MDAEAMQALLTQLSTALARPVADTFSRRTEAAREQADQAAAIEQLNGIIIELIEQYTDMARMAQVLREQFVAQQISSQELQFVSDTVIPLLRSWGGSALSDGEAAAADEAEDGTEPVGSPDGLAVLESLLSVETLTVLQSIGFNFKVALGEPGTIIVRQALLAAAQSRGVPVWGFPSAESEPDE